MRDTASIPTQQPARRASTATGAIRTLGADPATAPIVLHPGDAIPTSRRVVYIILLGALTALGPFTVDLYLPAFPVLQEDFHTTAAAIQLTLTGTMIGFALGQLIVGPLSDKVGRRVPLLTVTAVHVLASLAAALAPSLELLTVARVLMGMGAAAGGVVAMAVVRDLFGGRRLVVMLSRLALVSGVAPVVAPLIGSALLTVMPWRGIFVVLAVYGVVMLLAGGASYCLGGMWLLSRELVFDDAAWTSGAAPSDGAFAAKTRYRQQDAACALSASVRSIGTWPTAV